MGRMSDLNIERHEAGLEDEALEPSEDDMKELLLAHNIGENAMPTDREMPKYISHKEVWALKIKSIVNGSDGSGLIFPEDDGYEFVEVSKEYLERHKPEPGGYYVVYADGYKSFSPAKAFEDGYTLSRCYTLSR